MAVTKSWPLGTLDACVYVCVRVCVDVGDVVFIRAVYARMYAHRQIHCLKYTLYLARTDEGVRAKLRERGTRREREKGTSGREERGDGKND